MHVPVALGAERDLLLVGHEHLPRMNNEWLIWSERSKQRSHLGWSWAQHQISAARQVRLLCPPPIFRAGSSTDQNSWPTPNRCGLNSRTAHQAGLARRSSPQSIIARRWLDSSVTHQSLRDWQIWICSRLLSETKQVRFLHPAPE